MESQDTTGRDSVSWQRLRTRVLERDGHRCRNCTSKEYLEVHHWQPVAVDSAGIDARGYSGNPQIVPEPRLVTLCQICHSALTEARKIVRLSNDSSRLGPVSVQERTVFELWALNDRQLSMQVVRERWRQSADHYMLVERIEIRNWPYGFAWGRYYRNGEAAEEQKIGSAGSYEWRELP